MKTKIKDEIKEQIRKRVQHEFPDCKALQDLHYYRYIKDIEWQDMSNEEILKDIKKGANEIRKEMKQTEKKINL
jgi:hypothetical protein